MTLIGALTTINSFPGERMLALRERASGTYLASAYFFASKFVIVIFSLFLLLQLKGFSNPNSTCIEASVFIAQMYILLHLFCCEMYHLLVLISVYSPYIDISVLCYNVLQLH
jgi:type IV secretory pathway TrbL component